MQQAPVSTSVAIVGGGPAGLSLALELSLQGVDSIVIEPSMDVDFTRPRAKTTSARTMELFRRWGVADAVRAAAPIPREWSSRITFCETVLGDEITHLDGAFGLDLVGNELVAEAGQQVPQPVVERVLRTQAEASPRVTLMLGWRATGAHETSDSVHVDVVGPGGEVREILADWLVGADGARSVVRPAIGAKYEGAAGGRPNVNITFRSQELARRIPHPPSIHYWVLDRTTPGVVAPLDLDGTWWAVATGAGRIEDDAEARSLVSRLVGGAIDIEVIATDPWQARLLLADRYRRGRIFLIGDAAHQNPPWGGHGFNTGIGDAMNLGWKLAASIQGWGSEALLDSYQAERRPIARHTIDVAAGNMHTVPSDLTDGSAGERSARIHRVKGPEFFSLGLVLGYGYGAGSEAQAPSLEIYEPRAEAGNRLPHSWIAPGQSLFDQLGHGMTVLGAGPGSRSIADAIAALGAPVTHLDSAEVVDALGGRVIVVRPDQHIAWAGASVDSPTDIALAALSGFPDFSLPERSLA